MPARSQRNSSKSRRGTQRKISSIINMSIGDAIGTANTFGHLLSGENKNPELLAGMVYSNGATGSPKSNVDSFSKTGAVRLLGEETVIKHGYATLSFEDNNGSIAALVRCKVIGRQMVGDWQVFTP